VTGPSCRLNAADRFMLVIDRTVRGLGGPGFETVTFVCLDGRIDRAKLLRRLGDLNRICPVVTGRLREEVPCWELRPGAEVNFRETDLPTADRQAVLDHAAGLLAGETDPVRVDPMRFHLLHLPDGRDVFLAQYSHVLLDHARAVGVIRRLGTHADGAGECPPDADRWRDPVWAYLRRFPRALRHRSGREASDLRRDLRGGSIKLGQFTPGNPEATRYAITTRRLTAEETRAAEARVRAVVGVPNLSMAILAALFRGLDRLTAGRPDRGNYYQAGIALDLGLKDRPAHALENLSTLVPLRVPASEVRDHDGLLRALARQLLDRLAARTDIGILEMVTQFGRRRDRAGWVMDLLMRYCLCFWYGYLGALDVGPTFLGVPVVEAFSAGPTWPAVGVTLLANQFRGRLHLQLTSIPQVVPEPLAADYLDGVVADLLARAV
jgi:hypothetical protein